eukprot:g77314.t1
MCIQNCEILELEGVAEVSKMKFQTACRVACKDKVHGNGVTLVETMTPKYISLKMETRARSVQRAYQILRDRFRGVNPMLGNHPILSCHLLVI